MAAPHFDKSENADIEEQRRLRADQVFEVVRRDGEEELARPSSSLAWSGLAAGLAIGFSVVAEATLHYRLPAGGGWVPVVADAGYAVGFILVILGKLQLFTENTITPVLPICYAPTKKNFRSLARLWGIVFLANMVGAALFGTFIVYSGAFSPGMISEVVAISLHAADGSFMDISVKGIGAGFLIAALVWILANVKGGELFLVFVVTYVIALAEFSHVIAGAVEMAVLVLTGEMSFSGVVFGFIVPAFLGNVVGGTVLFALIAYGQIKDELTEKVKR
jgi:formate/nitrite transporter FocA (FNT family)